MVDMVLIYVNLKIIEKNWGRMILMKYMNNFYS